MKRNIPFYVGVTCFICICVVVYIYNSKKCQAYTCITFNEQSKWSAKEIYEKTDKTYRAILVNGNDKIRIEVRSVQSSTDAQLLTDIKTMQLKSMYENAKSPYPGMISDEIECQKQFKPVIRAEKSTGLTYTYVRTHLNKMLQSGSCIESDLSATAHMALFFCENQKKWYQFELISPWKTTMVDDDRIPAIITSLRCTR